MSKWKKGSWIVGALLVFLYLNQQRQQWLMQSTRLNNVFDRVQPKAGKVLFVLSNKGMMIQLSNDRSSKFKRSALLDVGSEFDVADQHFHVKYTVKRVQSNGVTISYTADGSQPSPVRNSYGWVKLGWK